MRNGLLLGGLATALAVAALVISVIALVSPPDALDELDDYEFRLSDRGEFTVELVRQALRRYDEEVSEATVSYYNSPESAAGEWYVFIYDENGQAIAHPNQNLLGQDLKGDRPSRVRAYPWSMSLWRSLRARSAHSGGDIPSMVRTTPKHKLFSRSALHTLLSVKSAKAFVRCRRTSYAV